MLSTRIRQVSSRQNSRVKQLRAALQRGDRAEGLVALEGLHLLREALRSDIAIVAVFVVAGHENLLEQITFPADFEALALPQDVFSSAVTTETPQPIAALALAPHFELPAVLGNRKQVPLILVAAGLQDPGNLGTLVRSAEAFGATGVIVLPGTTSVWNPKALRASSGSALRMPVVACTDEELADFRRTYGFRILAAVSGSHSADLHGSEGIGDLRGPCAILIGNEGAGLSPGLLALADERITIPHVGITESLNAAVAGSVLLYEAARQRRLR
jgi:TrmH family RNA methyltransferase